MINADISNIWSCLTLPQLLGCEKEIFDAHNFCVPTVPTNRICWAGWISPTVSPVD